MTTTTFPVLDQDNRDAEIIGHASSEAEAQAIALSHYLLCDPDADEIAAFKSENVMNFRGSALNDRYENIGEVGLASGYFAG